MFYLTTHTMLYLRLYDVGHMERDKSDNERIKPLPLRQGLLFLIFYMLLPVVDCTNALRV